MKILHYPEKGKIATFAKILADDQALNADKIPPAYEPSRDRLVIVGITAGKSLGDTLERFLRGLSKDKTQYVAIYTDAPDATVDTMKKLITEAGAVVLGVKNVKGSILPFLSGVKAPEADEIKAWANEMIAKAQS